MAGAAENSECEMSYKWTDEDVARLIRLRMSNQHLFSGKSLCSRAVLQDMGLTGLVSPARAAKKWENLKKSYKELRKPATGVGTETGKATAATWKWHSLTNEAIGSKPSVRPPCLIASSVEERPSTSMAPTPVSVPEEEEHEGERSRPAKKPRRESLMQFMEKAEKREEERDRRQDERERREEERDERLVKLLEKLIEKIN